MQMDPASREQPRRILFVDAYDSFTNNIVSLLETKLPAKVTVVHLDAHIPDLGNFLEPFDAVVVGPGPGNPTLPEDIGFISQIWSLPEAQVRPTFGICLGFQSLSLASGATVGRLTQPRHGIVTEILHKGQSIFNGVGGIEATQYHSLHVDIGHPIQTRRAVSWPSELWLPTKECPLLKPLAWDCGDLVNGAVLMGVQHLERPFWGVQFHPESACTNAECIKVIENWWAEACRWNDERRGSKQRAQLPHLAVPQDVETSGSRRTSLLERCQKSSLFPLLEDWSWDNLHGKHDLQWSRIRAGSLTVPDICEAMKVQEGDAIILDSAVTREGVGRYSIIGFIMPNRTIRVTYNVESHKVFIGNEWLEVLNEDLRKYGSDIWQYLAHFMEKHKVEGGDPESPFWGGLMGFISYEAGLETIGVSQPHGAARARAPRPDLSFAFVERSIVIDHQAGQVYVQSLIPHDTTWIEMTQKEVQTSAIGSNIRKIKNVTATLSETGEILLQALADPESEAKDKKRVAEYLRHAKVVEGPREEDYRQRVRQCQESIRAGDSYELCLTGQTTISMPRVDPDNMPWTLYKNLRKRNPAPFAAYIRLGSATVLSSSPERFLCWDRTGTCQLRPIKGTVKKTKDMTKILATDILNTPKERAENLMILDLIRHDLHGVVGSGNVHVQKLMGIEEYKTVFQLVSVIEGRLPQGDEPAAEKKDGEENKVDDRSDATTKKNQKERDASLPTGLDVLAASLPPGSMTGAPKRRSCQILKELENNAPRGIYSGVIGYLDVGGAGDFSVVIRTAYKWDDESYELETPIELETPAPTPAPLSRSLSSSTSRAGGSGTANGSGNETDSNAERSVNAEQHPPAQENGTATSIRPGESRDAPAGSDGSHTPLSTQVEPSISASLTSQSQPRHSTRSRSRSASRTQRSRSRSPTRSPTRSTPAQGPEAAPSQNSQNSQSPQHQHQQQTSQTLQPPGPAAAPPPPQKRQALVADVWHIGAGGAITGLSDDKAEWEEMRTKLDSALSSFVSSKRKSSRSSVSASTATSLRGSRATSTNAEAAGALGALGTGAGAGGVAPTGGLVTDPVAVDTEEVDADPDIDALLPADDDDDDDDVDNNNANGENGAPPLNGAQVAVLPMPAAMVRPGGVGFLPPGTPVLQVRMER